MSPDFSVTAPRAARFLLIVLAVLLALTVLAVHQTRAQTTITVPDGDVQGLITAIENGNDSSGAVTIELAASGDYVLTAEYPGDSFAGNGLPAITSEITIAGNGATIRRNPNSDNFRIFEVASDGDLHLENLTVSGGESPMFSIGGGIFVAGNLTLTDSGIINSSGFEGGGIYATNNAAVEITDSLIAGSTALNGGGLFITSNSTAVITDSVISGNLTTQGAGAGIYISQGEVDLIRSTLEGNNALGGGGISNSSGKVTLSNSTVSGNSASSIGSGGGISNGTNGEVILTSSTISGNTAGFEGGGIYNTGNLMLTGSIVAGNTVTESSDTASTNISGSINSNVASFIDGDPQLGPLQDNGGPTETHLPLDGSPVLDQIAAGDHGCGVAGEIDTDQRGVSRPQGTHCDIGAVELEQDFGFDHMEHIANPWFWATWARTDLPVRDGLIPRTWMWGPGPFTTSMWEPYTTTLQNPGGDPVVMDASQGAIPDETREVIYFDKAKMEINDPEGDTDSIWFVTNGLLVVEMITGNRQFGDDLFIRYAPSDSNVAGDADDMNGPTYASFQGVLDAPAQAVGTLLTGQIARSGNVTSSSSWGAFGVTVGHVDPVTNHGIAGPFWEFMNSQGLVHEGGATFEDALFANPYYATGRPVTEAYWADVMVAGEQRGVLIQCFERRCLTYTPGNPEGFVVEAGNVGQHYYYWRYIQAPD